VQQAPRGALVRPAAQGGMPAWATVGGGGERSAPAADLVFVLSMVIMLTSRVGSVWLAVPGVAQHGGAQRVLAQVRSMWDTPGGLVREAHVTQGW